MKTASVILLLLFSLAVPAFRQKRSFSGVELLDGYSVTREPTIDTSSWVIQGKNGFTIHFEAGPSEGRAVDLKDIEKYAWYREQTIRGHKVFLALTKPGTTREHDVDADLDAERNLPPGNVLLVTFPLGGHRDNAANFVEKIASQQEMIDMLLMVLTFDPSKGAF